jgi:hypothetical protein
MIMPGSRHPTVGTLVEIVYSDAVRGPTNINDLVGRYDREMRCAGC